MKGKVLFLVFHGFDKHNGISKKIWAQIRGLEQCGADVHLCYYDVLPDGRCVWIVNDEILADLGRGFIAKIKKRYDFSCLTEYVKRQKFSLVYIRSYHNADPFTIGMIKQFRADNARVVMEIPTFPYDQEYIRFRDRIVQWPDRIFRRVFASHLDAIVTFAPNEKIFGQQTIRISNGVDFDALPLRSPISPKIDELHLLAVAEIHYWHGYDRLILGLANYYIENPKLKVYFHLVGHFNNVDEEREFRELVTSSKLDSYVKYYGALSGEKLDQVFDHTSFAIGSLGRHRSGITYIRTLKNREYAARGIPFIYSEVDEDFEGKPYTLKAPADDSAIDISTIISFCRNIQFEPFAIRNDIQMLSWTCQMRKVIDVLKIKL